MRTLLFFLSFISFVTSGFTETTTKSGYVTIDEILPVFLEGDKFLVLRIDGAEYFPRELEEIAQEILDHECVYSYKTGRNFPDETYYDPTEPYKGDCKSTVAYLFRHALGYEIPSNHMGEWARGLLRDPNVSIAAVTNETLKPGDLLLWQSRKIASKDSPKDARLITHVAVALGPNRIFHNTGNKNIGGAIIEKLEQLEKRSYHVNNPMVLETYIDPRSKTGKKLYSEDSSVYYFFQE